MLRWSERKASHFDSTESHRICWSKWLSKWSGTLYVMSAHFSTTHQHFCLKKYEKIVIRSVYLIQVSLKVWQTDKVKKLLWELSSNKDYNVFSLVYLLCVVIDDILKPWRWWEALRLFFIVQLFFVQV